MCLVLLFIIVENKVHRIDKRNESKTGSDRLRFTNRSHIRFEGNLISGFNTEMKRKSDDLTRSVYRSVEILV